MATPPDFSPGQVLTAAHMDAVGLWLVGSATATSGTTCDVLSCFTADYDSYRVVISDLRQAAVADVSMTLLANTTPAASNWTFGNLRFDYAANNTNYNKGTGTATATVTIGGPLSSGMSMDFYGPFLSQYTTFTGMGTDTRATTGYVVNSISGQLSNTTSYNGLRISTTSTFTNITVRVYGYRN